MRALLLFSLGLAFAAQAQQPPDFGGAKQIEMLKKLSFLEGSWEGSVWMDYKGQKLTLKGREVVAFKAGGTVLAVDGKYTVMTNGNERVVHDAFAYITWSAKNGYILRSFLANGLNAEYTLQVREDGYTWSQTNPTLGGEVRYTMTLTNGRWVEIGERKEADRWVKFMELDVAKK